MKNIKKNILLFLLCFCLINIFSLSSNPLSSVSPQELEDIYIEAY